jgi:hypothetical protein
MTDLCTKQPFPIHLLLLVLVDTMLSLNTPLSNALNRTTELRILCVISCSQCLKNLGNDLCWRGKISGSKFVALSENAPLFFMSSTCRAFKYFTRLSTSRTRHGFGRCFVITLMTDAEPNSSRLSESRPFPQPRSQEMEWRILLCSKGPRMFSVLVRSVGLTTSWNVLRTSWYATETPLLSDNLRQAVEVT